MNPNKYHIYFSLYQIIMAFIILPLCYYLWLIKLNYRHDLVFLVIINPIIFGYIVPGLGTNYLKIWKFNAGIKFGDYTLLHGLMLGAATSFLGWCCVDVFSSDKSILQLIKSAHIMGITIGFWNWLFDIFAIKNSIAIIYNKPYFENKSPEYIASDYAPVYFGIFGAAYGIYLYLIFNLQLDYRTSFYWIFFLLSGLLTIVMPVLFYCLSSYIKHGYFGLYPYNERITK
ncbi:MAG: hypothetical protein HY934_08120 [Candidatus Firestonebacteria bacterium]|nr:hypothetical protein [Candidatus Firestonebacteria bacterium]